MPTDISHLKKVYRTVNNGLKFPENIELNLGNGFKKFARMEWRDGEGNGYPIRYGTNPNQPCAYYTPINAGNNALGTLNFLKMGKGGPSLTNLQDINQAMHIVKYFQQPAIAIMKHLNPSGVALGKDDCAVIKTLLQNARETDPRAAFGGVIVSNRIIDAEAAEEIMKNFFEVVAAPAFEPDAMTIFLDYKRFGVNKDIRIVSFSHLDVIPKYDGDDVRDFMIPRMFADGSIALETPFLTSIRSKDDLIFDVSMSETSVQRIPNEHEVEDMLTAWYITMNVRSNGIVFVKNGLTLAIGTGQQDRIGAVEQAILKAKQKGHALTGSVMASDGFFPRRDCIDMIAKEGITGVIYPGGSINDIEIIKAANEYNIALAITGERCFAHH